MTTYTGRRKIFTSVSADRLRDKDTLESVFRSAMNTHSLNKSEIDYLMNYHKGIQPILTKEKTVRPEINNTTVINNAFMITRTIVGYFLGTPIQYIQSKTDKKDAVEMLNDFVEYESKSAVDTEIGEDQSICGTAYRIILGDSSGADLVPFEDRRLDPAHTFVAYETSVMEDPVFGVTYYELFTEDGGADGYKVYLYTDYGVFSFKSDIEYSIPENEEVVFKAFNVGGIPIVEYPNNSWRMGDWEHAMSLMEDINALQSGRMDDLEQIVQSLLVFTNADIDEERYQEMRELGVVMLKNKTQNQSKVENIENSLDQTGINIYAKELQELLYSIVGIPSRDNRSGGGGDTGEAVELRDGWADLEIVARGKEANFKRSEKKTLSIILQILSATQESDLTLADVDIKFTRNKNHNLLVKTQSYQSLLSTKTLAPADALTIVDLVTDVNEYVSRGEAYWGDEFGNTGTETNQVAETDPETTE